MQTTIVLRISNHLGRKCNMNTQITMKQEEKAIYEMPAIIYEASITTRAGSPFLTSDEDSAVDPADLFGSD